MFTHRGGFVHGLGALKALWTKAREVVRGGSVACRSEINAWYVADLVGDLSGKRGLVKRDLETWTVKEDDLPEDED